MNTSCMHGPILGGRGSRNILFLAGYSGWAVLVALVSLNVAGCAQPLLPQLPAPHHPTPAFAANVPLLFKGGVGRHLDAGMWTQRWAGPSCDEPRRAGGREVGMMAWKIAKKDGQRYPEDVWRQVIPPSHAHGVLLSPL